jgi:hypothetical protein
MSTPSWRGQIQRALNAIDRIGESKYRAKKAQGWKPGEAVAGLFSFGYKNSAFDRAITFTNWLDEHYPDLRLFREVDQGIVAEYLLVKTETCTPDTVRTLIATMQKLRKVYWR